MSKIQLFRFENQEVRFVGTPDKPEWVAQDVCQVLGIANSRDALSRLDEYQKASVGIPDTSASTRKTITVQTVTEAGLYALIFTSRKEEAKRFQRWVFEEVLPTIRKRGSYSVNEPKEHPLEKIRTVYLNRMNDLEKTLVVPDGYFTVIQECAMVMFKIEQMGYPIDAYDMLDGSIGLTWSHYRKGQDWIKPTAIATLKVNQCPRPVEIKAYDFLELAQFRPWFQRVYKPVHMPKYLNKKYGELIKYEG
jgi:prophage antirepressor-like protein